MLRRQWPLQRLPVFLLPDRLGGRLGRALLAYLCGCPLSLRVGGAILNTAALPLLRPPLTSERRRRLGPGAGVRFPQALSPARTAPYAIARLLLRLLLLGRRRHSAMLARSRRHRNLVRRCGVST